MKLISDFSVMRRLIVLVKPLSGRMLLAISLGLIGHLAASGLSILAAYAVLAILGFPFPLSLERTASLLVLLAFLRSVCRYGEQTANHSIAFRLLALIRDRVFGALRRLCPAKLEVRNKGDLINLITSDIELLEVFYAHTISPVAIASLYTLLMTVFLSSYHLLLGLILLSAHLSLGLVLPLLSNRRARQKANENRNFRERSADLASFVLESLRGLPEILQFSQGPSRLQVLQDKSSHLLQEDQRLKALAARGQMISHLLIWFFNLLMLLAAILLWQQQQLNFDGLLIAELSLLSSFGPASALANLGSGLRNTLDSGQRVLALLDEKPAVTEIHDRAPATFGDVQVQDLNFAYQDEEILSDFEINIPKNSLLGICGPSGSGKSTLLKLLMRFWQADSGCIRIGDRELSSINSKELRDMESYVTQETQLFHDSIRENLRLAKLDASSEELEAACRKASIHDFIMSLPQGYDSMVGELGETLSGGERQRLGLARAFLHNAPFLLLDEPSSNLDSLNEAAILRALKTERQDRTILLVSHRPSTLRICERILELEPSRHS